ncbi:hypothetical protein AKJ16_DCAP27331, partial [Drosera capensis]
MLFIDQNCSEKVTLYQIAKTKTTRFVAQYRQFSSRKYGCTFLFCISTFLVDHTCNKTEQQSEDPKTQISTKGQQHKRKGLWSAYTSTVQVLFTNGQFPLEIESDWIVFVEVYV